MKKYIIGLIAIIVAVGGTAFMREKQTQHKNMAPLYWFNPSGTAYDGLRDKGSIGTPGTQINHTGCDGATTECERGYTSDKLINPSQPALGVDPNKVGQYTDRIFVHQ